MDFTASGKDSADCRNNESQTLRTDCAGGRNHTLQRGMVPDLFGSRAYPTIEAGKFSFLKLLVEKP
jgi:hypothetical protein